MKTNGVLRFYLTDKMDQISSLNTAHTEARPASSLLADIEPLRLPLCFFHISSGW